MRWIKYIPCVCIGSVLLVVESTAQTGTYSAALDLSGGLAYPVETIPGKLYQLEGRDTPFTNQWYGIEEPVLGTGEIEYCFERGAGPIFLPARRFEISTNTDGYALLFDGTNDFAFVAHHPYLSLTNQMTLAAWVKPNAVGNSIIMAKANSLSVICYSLGLDASNRVLFRIFNAAGNPYVSVTGTTSLASGVWRHVSATWNGSQGNVLIDGLVEGTTSTSGTTRVSSASPFQVGSIFGSLAFGGCLDQLQVWNLARSSSAIRSDYQVVLGSDTAGLIALWPLSSNEWQMASDVTSNNFSLTFGADPSPDDGDPIWRAESYPPSYEYVNILSFGEPCYVVGNVAVSGYVYQLQSSTNLISNNWTNRDVAVTAKCARVNHLLRPINQAEYFRNLGPSIPTIQLSGSLAYGYAATDANAYKSLKIYNAGYLPLNISHIEFPVGFSGSYTGQVAALSTQTVSIIFNPSLAQAYGGTVTVYSDAVSGTNTTVCSGTGVVCFNDNKCVAYMIVNPSTGACTPGPAVNCDDHNPLTIDSCDKNAGCQNVLQ